MNITKENFEDSFDVICEAIRTSHFIALDGEFTGLRLPDAKREKVMDTVKARYALGRSSCSSFMLTQFGVCCFRYRDDGVLEARPFNAFVVPSTKFGSDRVYTCQASSMDFLRKHGFDFQAWIAHGVPFLSRAQEAAIKDRLEARWTREAEAAVEEGKRKAERQQATAAAAVAVADGPDSNPAKPAAHAARDGTTLESLGEPEKEMVLDALRKVDALLAEGSGESEYAEKSVKLEPMNGRQRWLIHEFVGSSTSAIKLINLNGPHFARGMEIRTVCDDPELQAIADAKIIAESHAKQLDDLRIAVGFRRVVDEMAKSGKPIIGHNSLLDLLHTHDKFVGPIPEDCDAGTQALHALLPRFFDNKVVMSMATEAGLAFPRTVLGEGFAWLRETYPQNRGLREAPEDKIATDTSQTAVAGEQSRSISAAGGATVPDGANGTSPMAEGPVAGSIDQPDTFVEQVKSTDEADKASAVAAESRRQAWDAVFAAGFEERYGDGGQEHEAGYDAYLTGCCFAAAATLGLNVGVEELKDMATGGEIPAALKAVLNVIPLYKMLGGQRICLPGPTPPLDFGRYLHVSGFPSAARTAAIMLPVRSVGGCEGTFFHWIDDTSGVIECQSREAAVLLLRAVDAAASAISDDANLANTGGQEVPPAVDAAELALTDMKIVQLDGILAYGDDENKEMHGGSEGLGTAIMGQDGLKRAQDGEERAVKKRKTEESQPASEPTAM